MFNQNCIIALFIFALVFARANVYAQGSKAETQQNVVRTGDINQTLLSEGIDSVLASVKFSRENISIEVDTEKKDTAVFSHSENANVRVGKYIGKLIINRLTSTHTIFSSSNGVEEGIYSVSASGVLCCLPSSVSEQKFSFARSSKYRTNYDASNVNEPKSFWDSTAKPILVTLGAVAVIALFFLIRG